MSYVLGESPRTGSDAFDALEGVFGGDEFSAAEAEEVLREVLDLDSSGSRAELNRLIRSRSVEEA